MVPAPEVSLATDPRPSYREPPPPRLHPLLETAPNNIRGEDRVPAHSPLRGTLLDCVLSSELPTASRASHGPAQRRPLPHQGPWLTEILRAHPVSEPGLRQSRPTTHLCLSGSYQLIEYLGGFASICHARWVWNFVKQLKATYSVSESIAD